MGVAVGCGARCGAFPAARYGAARSPRYGAARSERRGAARCVPRRAVPAVRSPPGRGARPWQRWGRRGCCACGRRRCRTIWLSPCRKGVGALRLSAHVTVRGGRAGSLGSGERRAPPGSASLARAGRREAPSAGRRARGPSAPRAPQPLAPLSPSRPSAPRSPQPLAPLGPAAASPPPSLHAPLVALPHPLGSCLGILSFPPVVAVFGGRVAHSWCWGLQGLGSPGPRRQVKPSVCWVAKAGSSGRRVHACLKQPPAALGTWSSGPGGCECSDKEGMNSLSYQDL
ncbi:transcription initiation factor TFIID subunit 4-like [Vidua chalybeata]|uniref:transcription initiation factor TFIID subunit 4-like n=1 Tax=Vidua chalybeata TaxID=81927 RepID=UPI0023A84B55|nr:transcription initiation factor TFIID subunit 4-like [Vidua chalybeata]